MSDKQKFYLTTPIYYVNARPHIGHAYTTIAADVIARRHRLLGDDTFFLTGTDEHGQKVERSAAAAGISPQQFADEVSASFRTLWDRMGITYNDYIRTTDDRHKLGVQKLWRELESHGFIYLSTYTGQYSVGEEMFVDGPPGTIGPDGKPTETVTEENYFFKLSEFQKPLLDFYAANPEFISPAGVRNEVLSFVRGGLTLGLEAHREATGIIDIPDAYSSDEIKLALEAGFLKESPSGEPYSPGALKDLSISRTTFDWGIPVPDNPKHVIYVWLDALSNYMTAIGYGAELRTDLTEARKRQELEKFAQFWPSDIHLVGKEITRFHCVYWPAFLLALNPALTGKKPSEVPAEVHREWAKKMLPKRVVAHGWLLFEESKMSKSRGNIVRTETILDAFGTEVYAKQFPESTKQEQDLFGADVLRYFLLREIPFGQDGSFSFDALVQRYNSDLANGYGNLVSRTLAMIAKYSASQIPATTALSNELSLHAQQHFFGFISGPGKGAFDNELDKRDYRIRFSAGSLEQGVGRAFESFDLTRTVENPLWAVSGTDSYLTANAPWKMPEGPERDNVLYTAAESIRIITALLHPILPYTTAKVWAQLGLGDIELAAQNGELNSLAWGGLKPGTKLGALAPIFPRAPKELAQIMTDMEAPTPSKLVDEKTTHTSPAPADPTHPGAAPRTSSLPIENPAATVGGSHAITTERTGTPSHTEATASGLFANTPKTEAAAPETTPQIAIDDFIKIDLRVAKILVAERIPKADKLLRLEVDLGSEKRQILSGIAEWYTPEDLIGRTIVVIANLAPRKMRGLESHGMLLAASEGENGKPILATFGEGIAPGTRLR